MDRYPLVLGDIHELDATTFQDSRGECVVACITPWPTRSKYGFQPPLDTKREEFGKLINRQVTRDFVRGQSPFAGREFVRRLLSCAGGIA